MLSVFHLHQEIVNCITKSIYSDWYYWLRRILQMEEDALSTGKHYTYAVGDTVYQCFYKMWTDRWILRLGDTEGIPIAGLSRPASCRSRGGGRFSSHGHFLRIHSDQVRGTHLNSAGKHNTLGWVTTIGLLQHSITS